jgi:hypothetical protein
MSGACPLDISLRERLSGLRRHGGFSLDMQVIWQVSGALAGPPVVDVLRDCMCSQSGRVRSHATPKWPRQLRQVGACRRMRWCPLLSATVPRQRQAMPTADAPRNGEKPWEVRQWFCLWGRLTDRSSALVLRCTRPRVPWCLHTQATSPGAGRPCGRRRGLPGRQWLR